MARIVDLEKFIEQYPFKPDTIAREWTLQWMIRFFRGIKALYAKY